MASTLTMLGALSKGRLPSHRTVSGTNSSQSNHTKPQLSDDVVLSDDEFSVASPTFDDTALIVEEPSYTIVPKSDDSADIDLGWTDVGAEDRIRARRKLEERKKKELKERQERELQERRKKEEEQKIREEERKSAEAEHKRALEERLVQEETERKQREEDERRRKEEEQRKHEEAERKLRENYETAARTREERARDAERKKQESLRIQERRKLENVIQERDEREQALQERLNVLEDEQQVFAIQIRELMEHSEFLKTQNRTLQTRLDRQFEEHKTFKKDHVRDSSTATRDLSRFLNINSVKTNKSVEQEVVMLLDILNSEVYQAAACIADLLETRSQLPLNSGPGAAEESRLIKVIGKGLTEVLKARTIEGADFDPLIVQVALQMCLNHCCAKIIRSWCPGMWNYSDFLSTLYTGIRATEDSATANKWRAVTHAQFRQNENTKTSMTHFIIEHLIALLTFIGLPDSSKDWVTELLEERCPIIVGPALHINNAIFEDAGSDRLDIVLVRPEELFDNFTMENSFGRNGDTGEVVIATADLGFRRIAGDYLAVAHLVKPKVVLASAFDDDTRHILELSG